MHSSTQQQPKLLGQSLSYERSAEATEIDWVACDKTGNTGRMAHTVWPILCVRQSMQLAHDGPLRPKYWPMMAHKLTHKLAHNRSREGTAGWPRLCERQSMQLAHYDPQTGP
jgi:hypothetical protein